MDCASVRRIAVATALHLLAALHRAGPCAAAARPLVGRLPAAAPRSRAAAAATTTSALAVSPAAAHPRRAAATEGKWLPFAGAHHLPPAYWAHKPVPSWVGLGAGELGAGAAAGAAERVEGEGEEEEVVARDGEQRRRRRQRPSYGADGASSTRQEQLAMWASLLNPKRRGGSAATGWLPGAGIGEAADDEPAKQASEAAVVEGAEGDETSAGQSYWGNNGN